MKSMTVANIVMFYWWISNNQVSLSSTSFSFLDVLPARQYLDRIGQLFFGVPPKQSPSYGGLLGERTKIFYLSLKKKII